VHNDVIPAPVPESPFQNFQAALGSPFLHIQSKKLVRNTLILSIIKETGVEWYGAII
jgi:hypothetical protein